jgi:hypothetical protein
MKTVEQAWKEHGVDDDQPAHELFVYGWEAHEAEADARIAALEAENAKLREVLKYARRMVKPSECDTVYIDAALDAARSVLSQKEQG